MSKFFFLTVTKLYYHWKRSISYLCSLPADVLWGSFVMHSFLPHECVINEPQRTSAGRLLSLSFLRFLLERAPLWQSIWILRARLIYIMNLIFWIMIFLNYSRLTNLPLDPSLVWVTRRNFITKIAIVPNAITSTTPPPIKTAITHDTELLSLPYLLLSRDVDGIVWILVRSVENETEFKSEPSWTN